MEVGMEKELFKLVLGIGTDIVENKRIAKVINRSGERFLNKVFTENEILYCTGKNGLKITSVAARFAGKEAVAKALGTGLGPIEWKEIEIINNNKGEPAVKLLGKALKAADEKGGSEVKISLSHTEEYSVAFAILMS